MTLERSFFCPRQSRLEEQLATARDMHQRLEKQLERLRADAAKNDSQTHAVKKKNPPEYTGQRRSSRF